MRSPRWNSESVTKRKRVRFTGIVAFARANSQYYRELWGSLLEQLEDLRLLPVTARHGLNHVAVAVSLASSKAQDHIVSVYRSADRLAEVPTSSVLPQLGFHDLGWYEFLYLTIVVVPLVLLLNQRPGLQASSRRHSCLCTCQCDRARLLTGQ